MLCFAEIPWDSQNPTAAEWKTRNAWLLIFNTKGAAGLGINTSGTVWVSYTSNYEGISDIAKLNAEQELRNLTYSDNNNFPNHITLLQKQTCCHDSPWTGI